MTTADDSLFEPFGSGAARKPGASGGSSILPSGISKKQYAMAVDIIIANPKQLYLDAANDVIAHAVKSYPNLQDVRAQTHSLALKSPSGAYRLDTLVDQFCDGTSDFWVACPGLMAPRQFQFAGRFGYAKVWRLAAQSPTQNIPQFTADWYYIESSEGQLHAVELGIILLVPNTKLHHIFKHRNDAQSYYNS